MAGTFRELDAYQRACALAADLYEATSHWPKFERWTVGIQLVRAADSVGANIAEADGRWHRGDQSRHLHIARGSLSELEHWLLCAEERGLLTPGHASRVDEIARPLNGLIKKRR